MKQSAKYNPPRTASGRKRENMKKAIPWKNRYAVRAREAGDEIEVADTLLAAKEIIDRFENDDKAYGIYEENFYEVYDRVTESVVD